jgi:hypothetical protein
VVDVNPSKQLSSVVVEVNPSRQLSSVVVDVRPSRQLSSVVVDVRPSKQLSSVVVDVRPSRQFSSAVVAVKPSKQPSSVFVTGLEQIVLLSAQRVTVSAVPSPSTLPDVVANISAKSLPADRIPPLVDDTDTDPE